MDILPCQPCNVTQTSAKDSVITISRPEAATNTPSIDNLTRTSASVGGAIEAVENGRVLGATKEVEGISAQRKADVDASPKADISPQDIPKSSSIAYHGHTTPLIASGIDIMRKCLTRRCSVPIKDINTKNNFKFGTTYICKDYHGRLVTKFEIKRDNAAKSKHRSSNKRRKKNQCQACEHEGRQIKYSKSQSKKHGFDHVSPNKSSSEKSCHDCAALLQSNFASKSTSKSSHRTSKASKSAVFSMLANNAMETEHKNTCNTATIKPSHVIRLKIIRYGASENDRICSTSEFAHGSQAVQYNITKSAPKDEKTNLKPKTSVSIGSDSNTVKLNLTPRTSPTEINLKPTSPTVSTNQTAPNDGDNTSDFVNLNQGNCSRTTISNSTTVQIPLANATLSDYYESSAIPGYDKQTAELRYQSDKDGIGYSSPGWTAIAARQLSTECISDKGIALPMNQSESSVQPVDLTAKPPFTLHENVLNSPPVSISPAFVGEMSESDDKTTPTYQFPTSQMSPSMKQVDTNSVPNIDDLPESESVYQGSSTGATSVFQECYNPAVMNSSEDATLVYKSIPKSDLENRDNSSCESIQMRAKEDNFNSSLENEQISETVSACNDQSEIHIECDSMKRDVPVAPKNEHLPTTLRPEPRLQHSRDEDHVSCKDYTDAAPSTSGEPPVLTSASNPIPPISDDDVCNLMKRTPSKAPNDSKAVPQAVPLMQSNSHYDLSNASRCGVIESEVTPDHAMYYKEDSFPDINANIPEQPRLKGEKVPVIVPSENKGDEPEHTKQCVINTDNVDISKQLVRAQDFKSNKAELCGIIPSVNDKATALKEGADTTETSGDDCTQQNNADNVIDLTEELNMKHDIPCFNLHECFENKAEYQSGEGDSQFASIGNATPILKIKDVISNGDPSQSDNISNITNKESSKLEDLQSCDVKPQIAVEENFRDSGTKSPKQYEVSAENADENEAQDRGEHCSIDEQSYATNVVSHVESYDNQERRSYGLDPKVEQNLLSEDKVLSSKKDHTDDSQSAMNNVETPSGCQEPSLAVLTQMKEILMESIAKIDNGIIEDGIIEDEIMCDIKKSLNEIAHTNTVLPNVAEVQNTPSERIFDPSECKEGWKDTSVDNLNMVTDAQISSEQHQQTPTESKDFEQVEKCEAQSTTTSIDSFDNLTDVSTTQVPDDSLSKSDLHCSSKSSTQTQKLNGPEDTHGSKDLSRKPNTVASNPLSPSSSSVNHPKSDETKSNVDDGAQNTQSCVLDLAVKGNGKVQVETVPPHATVDLANEASQSPVTTPDGASQTMGSAMSECTHDEVIIDTSQDNCTEIDSDWELLPDEPLVIDEGNSNNITSTVQPSTNEISQGTYVAPQTVVDHDKENPSLTKRETLPITIPDSHVDHTSQQKQLAISSPTNLVSTTNKDTHFELNATRDQTLLKLDDGNTLADVDKSTSLSGASPACTAKAKTSIHQQNEHPPRENRCKVGNPSYRAKHPQLSTSTLATVGPIALFKTFHSTVKAAIRKVENKTHQAENTQLYDKSSGESTRQLVRDVASVHNSIDRVASRSKRPIKDEQSAHPRKLRPIVYEDTAANYCQQPQIAVTASPGRCMVQSNSTSAQPQSLLDKLSSFPMTVETEEENMPSSVKQNWLDRTNQMPMAAAVTCSSDDSDDRHNKKTKIKQPEGICRPVEPVIAQRGRQPQVAMVQIDGQNIAMVFDENGQPIFPNGALNPQQVRLQQTPAINERPMCISESAKVVQQPTRIQRKLNHNIPLNTREGHFNPLGNQVYHHSAPLAATTPTSSALSTNVSITPKVAASGQAVSVHDLSKLYLKRLETPSGKNTVITDIARLEQISNDIQQNRIKPHFSMPRNSNAVDSNVNVLHYPYDNDEPLTKAHKRIVSRKQEAVQQAIGRAGDRARNKTRVGQQQQQGQNVVDDKDKQLQLLRMQHQQLIDGRSPRRQHNKMFAPQQTEEQCDQLQHEQEVALQQLHKLKYEDETFQPPPGQQQSRKQRPNNKANCQQFTTPKSANVPNRQIYFMQPKQQNTIQPKPPKQQLYEHLQQQIQTRTSSVSQQQVNSIDQQQQQQQQQQYHLQQLQQQKLHQQQLEEQKKQLQQQLLAIDQQQQLEGHKQLSRLQQKQQPLRPKPQQSQQTIAIPPPNLFLIPIKQQEQPPQQKHLQDKSPPLPYHQSINVLPNQVQVLSPQGQHRFFFVVQPQNNAQLSSNQPGVRFQQPNVQSQQQQQINRQPPGNVRNSSSGDRRDDVHKLQTNIQQNVPRMSPSDVESASLPRIVDVRSMANDSPQKQQLQHANPMSTRQHKPSPETNRIPPQIGNRDITPVSYTHMGVHNDSLKNTTTPMTLANTHSNVQARPRQSNLPVSPGINGVQAAEAVLIPQHILHPKINLNIDGDKFVHHQIDFLKSNSAPRRLNQKNVLRSGQGTSVSVIDPHKISPPIPVHRVAVPLRPVEVASSETQVHFGGQKYKLQIAADKQGSQDPLARLQKNVPVQKTERKRSATGDVLSEPGKKQPKTFLNPLPTGIADAPVRTPPPTAPIRLLSPQVHSVSDTNTKNKTTENNTVANRYSSQTTSPDVRGGVSEESVPIDLSCSKR